MLTVSVDVMGFPVPKLTLQHMIARCLSAASWVSRCTAINLRYCCIRYAAQRTRRNTRVRRAKRMTTLTDTHTSHDHDAARNTTAIDSDKACTTSRFVHQI